VFTPIHLLGYDIYNNPKNNVSQRIAFLKKDYFKNVSIRMVRNADILLFVKKLRTMCTIRDIFKLFTFLLSNRILKILYTRAYLARLTF
jgi:hypothetical protein